MKKILLLKTTARFFASVATAFLVVSALVVWAGRETEFRVSWHEQWRQKVAYYRVDRDWGSSDRPQLCAQIRSGTVSPQEALATIRASVSLENPEGCEWIERLRADAENPTLWAVEWGRCEHLARDHAPEKLLALSEAGCVDPYSVSGFRESPKLADPGSFARYLWENKLSRRDVTDAALVFFAVSLGIFLLLTSGRVILTETHQGWKRLSLLVGAAMLLIAPLSILLSAHRVRDEDVALAIAAALAAFPLVILIMLGGRRIASWVAVGFAPNPAATDGQSSTVGRGPSISPALPVRELTERGAQEPSTARASVSGGTNTEREGSRAVKAFGCWLLGMIAGLVVGQIAVLGLVAVGVGGIGPAIFLGLVLSIGGGFSAGRSLALAKAHESLSPGKRWFFWGMILGGLTLPGLLAAWVTSGLTQRSLAA